MRALALTAVILATPASAQVIDTSSTHGAERLLHQSVVVAASPAQVWKAFTTAEGFTAWAVPKARIDLRLGGLIESTYDASSEIGGPTTIANEIVAFVPERVLAFRNVRAPANVPFDAATFNKLHTVILIDPLPDGRSRVSAVQPGHGASGAAKGVYDFFAAGNRYTLEQLKAHLESPQGRPGT
jgi:uncharacterized protein YndB with AHSA1/START domain